MKIAIITGGESGEREVSINSAKNIADSITFTEIETFVFPEDKGRFVDSIKDYDTAIPMIHGTGGEDGQVQRLFEELTIPYLFSGVEASELTIDKRATKEVANRLGHKIAKEILMDDLQFPVFAKPVSSGSSLACKLCTAQSELDELLAEHPDEEFMFEQPITGREFTVGVIEHDGKTIALPVIEIISKNLVFDYESKYNPEFLAEEVCPANISDELTLQLQTQALEIHKAVGAKHMSRSDFMTDVNNTTYFLEINTIPGMTDTSLVPKMLRTADISLESLLKQWIENSI